MNQLTKIINEDEIIFDLKKDFFTHDLCELAKDINLELTNKEQFLLKILTNVLYWNGKYPIAKTKEKDLEFSLVLEQCRVKPEELEKNGSKLRGKIFDPEIKLNLENYEKIRIKIENYFNDISIQ